MMMNWNDSDLPCLGGALKLSDLGRTISRKTLGRPPLAVPVFGRYTHVSCILGMNTGTVRYHTIKQSSYQYEYCNIRVRTYHIRYAARNASALCVGLVLDFCGQVWVGKTPPRAHAHTVRPSSHYDMLV